MRWTFQAFVDHLNCEDFDDLKKSMTKTIIAVHLLLTMATQSRCRQVF